VILPASLLSTFSPASPKAPGKVSAVSDDASEKESKAAEDAETIADDTSAAPADASMQLSLERISENITDAQGNILARMYFDKPILSREEFDLREKTVDDIAVSRINAYFEEELRGFFYGSAQSKHFARGHYDDFFDSVARMRESLGDKALAKSPPYCTVDSEVAYMTRDILSIKQSFDLMDGGARTLRYYGSTFDLNTGELLTLDRFVGAGREDFEAKVFAQLEKNFSVGIEEIHDYERFLAQLREKDIGEHEFYYDGQNIRLIFNEDIRPGMGFILRYR
jgi:hypothetical protein